MPAFNYKRRNMFRTPSAALRYRAGLEWDSEPDPPKAPILPQHPAICGRHEFHSRDVRFQRLDHLLRLPRNQYPQICARRSASPAPEITVCFMLAITTAAMWNITRTLQEHEGRSSAADSSQRSKRLSGIRGRSRTKLPQDCWAPKPLCSNAPAQPSGPCHERLGERISRTILHAASHPLLDGCRAPALLSGWDRGDDRKNR